MKTEHIKITNRPGKKLPCILAAFIPWLLPAIILFVATESSFAADATWAGGQGGPDHVGDWNFVEPIIPGLPGPGPRFPGQTNWNPNTTIPNGPNDVATFGFSNFTNVFISANTEVNSIIFSAAATTPYTITAGQGLTLTISGVGITNNSSITENFVTSGGAGGTFLRPPGFIVFSNSATAGNATITNNGGVGGFGSGGVTLFSNTSTAGNATLIANGGTGGGLGGTISFTGDSTGGTARVEVFGNGGLDISGHAAPGVTIGSIEGSGAVFLGGNNLTVGSNNLDTAFSGTINDGGQFGGTGGSLTKVGTGTLTLSGINTYTGTTFVNEGTLTLVGVARPFNQNLVINGPLIIGDDIGATNTAIVIDSGAFGTIGGLNNNNSTPVTVNSDGLLQVDVAEEITSPLVIHRGNVRVTTSFKFNTLQMIGGSISGVGEIILEGPLLTATSDASGKAATIGSNVDIRTTSKVFTINDGPGSMDLLISGVIFPSPSAPSPVGITKEGTGTLVLSGMNAYTGATTVNSGSLIVDGSIASLQTVVNANGLLGGNGTIGLGRIVGDLTNGGIVNPGHSPGTLTVAGNYMQTAGGTLQIEIAGTTPGQFDLLRVGRHASLAGTLQLIPLGNFQLQAGNKVTFLTAQGGVSGTFSTIQNPFLSNTLIKAEINILGNTVQLEGTQGSFTQVACNPNTAAVGGALNSAVGDPRASGLINFLDTQPLNAICPEMELISPEELPAVFNVSVSLANIQSVNLARRMEDIRAGSSGFSAAGFAINTRGRDFNMGLAGPTGPEGKSGPPVMQPRPDNRWGVWVTGLGEFTDVDSTSNAPGFDLTTGGMTFGADYRVSPNFAIGLTGGYAHTNGDLVNNGSLDVNGGTIGAYATAFGGGFYVNAAATGTFNGYDSHRTALLGTASGDTNGNDFNGLVAAGYEWRKGGLTIGPTASYQYTYVDVDGFTESGSLAPLTLSDQNANSNRTTLGAKASYDWHVGHVVVRPELRAAWGHEFGDTDYSIVSRFANGAGNSFTVNGPAIGRDSLLIGAGAAVSLNDRVSVYAYYDGELARTNYSSNSVSGGLRITF